MALDEAGFIKKDVLNVLTPTFQLDKLACMATSTIGESDGALFNRMLKNPRFQHYIKRYICESCEKNGVRGEACVHRIADRPPWFADDGDKFVKEMFGHESEKFARETLGMVNDDFDSHVFSGLHIEEILNKPRFDLQYEAKIVYICIDPCNGSQNADAISSHYCIVSYVDPHTVVGMDCIDAPNFEIADSALRRHIDALHTNKWLKRSIIVLDVEAGTGFEADRTIHLVNRIYGKSATGIIPMCSFKSRKFGTQTTAATKREMAIIAQELIATGKLKIMKDYITFTPNIEEYFEDQLKAYQKYVKPGKTVFDENIVTYSGKGESKKNPDDLAVTLQRAMSLAYNFYKTNEGINFYQNLAGARS